MSAARKLQTPQHNHAVAQDAVPPQFGLVTADASSDEPTSAGSATPTKRPPLIEMAMPGVHDAAKRLVATLPRGSLVDLGAGRGAFSLWSDQQGFATTAVDIDKGNFVTDSIKFVHADINTTLPLESDSTDIGVALEVIEHLENPYALMRELARIVRPGGYVVVSTPNETSLAARMSYLVSGFFSDASYVMRVPASGEHYYPHINCLPLPTLEYAWRRAGLKLVKFQPSRTRFLSCLLWPILAPLQWFKLAVRHHKPRHADRTTELAAYRLMNDPRVLTSRILVFLLQKPLENESA